MAESRFNAEAVYRLRREADAQAAAARAVRAVAAEFRDAARVELRPQPVEVAVDQMVRFNVVGLTEEADMAVRQRRQDAEKRAMTLLMANLNEEQRDCVKRFGRFNVYGGDTGWRYDLPTQLHESVYISGSRNWSHDMPACVYIPHVPGPDSALGMKWQIEFMERAFWKYCLRLHAPTDYFDAKERKAVSEALPNVPESVLRFMQW